jgi:membrane-bound metal-dependent hydrolase YbcI (DUF457 family)
MPYDWVVQSGSGPGSTSSSTHAVRDQPAGRRRQAADCRIAPSPYGTELAARVMEDRMFIGHFAVGMAARPLAPKASLGTLFLAAQFIDLLWPTLLLLGIEQVRIEPGITAMTPLDFIHYPVSHSLLAVLGWAVALALAYFAIRRERREALVLGLLVVSHWLLDALVHRPDLPLFPGDSPRVGLGLWQSVPGTLAVELALLAAGVWIYLRTTEARDSTGRWALYGLVAFLLLIYASNVLGPPPPSVEAIAWVGHAQWLLVAWGYWVDAHRQIRFPAAARYSPGRATQ